MSLPHTFFIGRGGGDNTPVITSLADILSSIDSEINGSEITHNGYGFMLYTGEHVGASMTLSATMDTSKLDTIRFVLMGGGGAASNKNITSGSSSGGIEGLINVSGQSSITLIVGAGGQASHTPPSNNRGGGGYSEIKFGSTSIAMAEGGRQVDTSWYNSVRSTTTYQTTYCTPISRAAGGYGEPTNQTGRQPQVVLNPTLSGAYAHGACSGEHGINLAGDAALGYGGGGGGTQGSTLQSPGGPLGYKGGLGGSGSGTSAEGPSVSAGTSYGKNAIGIGSQTHPAGGGGGGAFGAGGLEVYDIAQGATGLVKIWWASNTGDIGALSTVGNLYS